VTRFDSLGRPEPLPALKLAEVASLVILTAANGTLDFESVAFKVAYSRIVAAIALAAGSPIFVATGNLAARSADENG
jgi:hypothetical protein